MAQFFHIFFPDQVLPLVEQAVQKRENLSQIHGFPSNGGQQEAATVTWLFSSEQGATTLVDCGYSAYLVQAPKTMALTIVAHFISHVR
jgi:hypothetical protein